MALNRKGDASEQLFCCFLLSLHEGLKREFGQTCACGLVHIY